MQIFRIIGKVASGSHGSNQWYHQLPTLVDNTAYGFIILVEKSIHAIENWDWEYVVEIFLVFTKALDTVDHTILLDKLYHYGIRYCARVCLKLLNRQYPVLYYL